MHHWLALPALLLAMPTSGAAADLPSGDPLVGACAFVVAIDQSLAGYDVTDTHRTEHAGRPWVYLDARGAEGYQEGYFSCAFDDAASPPTLTEFFEATCY